MARVPRDLVDSYHRLVSREVPGLTRQEVEEQLSLIVNGQRPATYAGELIGHLYAMLALPIPAG